MRPLDLEDARLELLTSSRPSRGGVAATLLAARDLIARFRVDRPPADSRQPERSDLPFARSGRWWALLSTRGAGSHGLSYLVDSARR